MKVQNKLQAWMKDFRDEKGFDNAQLERETGISQSTLSRIFSSKPGTYSISDETILPFRVKPQRKIAQHLPRISVCSPIG
jgi:hypothetical protein